MATDVTGFIFFKIWHQYANVDTCA